MIVRRSEAGSTSVPLLPSVDCVSSDSTQCWRMGLLEVAEGLSDFLVALMPLLISMFSLSAFGSIEEAVDIVKSFPR